jgi:hypothetical protein
MLNKLHLGRTKAESIVTEFLGPAYLHKIINYLNNENVFAFSIPTDATNKKKCEAIPSQCSIFQY